MLDLKRILANVKLAEVPTKVEGFVDLINYHRVEGWAVCRDGQAIELKLDSDGEIFDLQPKWLPREDVIMAHGEGACNAGFIVELPASVRDSLKYGKYAPEDILVTANGVKLRYAPAAVAPSAPLDDSVDSDELLETDALKVLYSEDGEAFGSVASFDKFMITGYLRLCETAVPDVLILVAGKPVDCPVMWTKDDSDSLSANAPGTGHYCFEVQIPGYIWEVDNRSSGDAIRITLQVSWAAKGLSLLLSKKSACRWIHEISHLVDAPQSQYFGLVALEHLRYSGLFDALDDACAGFYRTLLEKMQLVDFMQNGLSTSAALSDDVVSGVDYRTQELWKAQKALNRKMLCGPERVFDLVCDTLKEQRILQLDIKRSFLISVIPLLAKKRQLLELKQLLDFRELYDLGSSENTWELSLSIAVLVAERKFEHAKNAIFRLSKSLDRGWLNTECIWFSVRHTRDLLEEGEATLEEADKVMWGILAIFDALDGEWFSRIHDQMLHKAMVAMLQQLDLVSVYLKDRIHAAAIRHYGLSPNFWEEVTASGFNRQQNTLFHRAHRNWLKVEALFESELELTDAFKGALEALQFFERHGNREAVSMRREMICAFLQNYNAEQRADLQYLVEAAVSDDPLEAIRYAAHPLIAEETAQQLLQEYRSEIFESLRANSGKPVITTYQAQLAAAEDLKQGAVNPEKLLLLNHSSAKYLINDVIVSAFARQPSLDEHYLRLLDCYLNNAISQSSPDDFLPAPVCAAVANLNHLARSNRRLNVFMAGIRHAIASKFGERHSMLSQLSSADAVNDLCSAPGWPGDTLVVIYSCRAYLDSRIKAIRDTWLKDLQERNIPYLILVGDGDGHLNGDVLELDVSDTYEDLPAKTLKLFEWVYQNTRAQYVLKIDDDCCLDVGTYFDSLTYRKHHYYGRILHRSEGAMDRAWHHSKSKTERARKSIDKSPEPSTYADGGGAYTLSRTAIEQLVRVAKKRPGQWLIMNSFMEDKLVGDLLAACHLSPSDEGYECYQRRRTFGAATPVAMYENIFYSSSSTPTVVTHLDGHRDQSTVREIKALPGLWPKKIWPSCWQVNIQLNSNQLELLTDVAEAQRLNAKRLFVVAAIRNEMIMLPHFLQHYRALGVEAFIISDNCSDDGTREYLLQQLDVILYSVDTEYKHSHYGVAWQQAILSSHCVGKWALIADADELLRYSDMETRSLAEFVQEVEDMGGDCVRTDMIDMYPFGDLAEADFTKDSPFDVAGWCDKNPLHEWVLGAGHYSNCKNVVSALRHRVDSEVEPNAFVSQKYALIKYKPWMRFSEGLHCATGVNVAATNAEFAHFKYHAGFKSKVADEIARKQHYDGAKEYLRYQSMLAESSGGFGDAQLSMQVKLEKEVK